MLNIGRPKHGKPGEERSAWVGGVVCLAFAAVFALAAAAAHRLTGGWLYPSVALLLAAFEAGMAVWSFRRSRRFLRDVRAGQGRCPNCGYDLTANASGVCPECGSATPAAGRTRSAGGAG